jgi:hypothetical protein
MVIRLFVAIRDYDSVLTQPLPRNGPYVICLGARNGIHISILAHTFRISDRQHLHYSIGTVEQ